MPLRYVCECGKKTAPTEAELHKLGIVIVRYYCDDCVSVAQAFLNGRDGLQDKMQAQWNAGLKRLKTTAHKAAPDLKLPDTGDG